MTYYKPKNASARGSGKNESASMCCLMGPDILENPLADFFQPRLLAEKKGLPPRAEADFRVNTCKVMATDMLSTRGSRKTLVDNPACDDLEPQ